MRFNNELMEGQMNHAGIGIDKVTAITANGFVRQSQNFNNPDFKGESYIDFDSEASYDELGLQKVIPKSRPHIVPALNLFGLPEYISSDEE